MPNRNKNQDIETRLRELTEKTRRTRRELEELLQRPEDSAERARAQAEDRAQFFRRRRSRTDKPS